MRIVVGVKIVQGEIGPFDAAALECALATGAETTVLCMGPEAVREPLRKLTRRGDFRTVLLCDRAYAGSDTLATATVLAAAVRKLEPDLVLCGRQTMDGDTGQTGPCLAALLGWRLVPNVLDFSLEKCRTRTGAEVLRRPAVVTVERIAELRFPSLFAKEKPVEVWDNTRLGVAEEACGLAGSPTRVLQTFAAEQGNRKCRFISRNELEPLLEQLRKRPRRGWAIPESGKKFRRIWAVGHEVEKQAWAIADEVVFLEKTTSEEIARRAAAEKPEVILWNADLWGRRNAPGVAAFLRTGLCADCTSLETDGKRLWMYRPTYGGSVMAKIECRTLPQMATVRTDSGGGEVIFSCGRGAADKWSKVKKLAKTLGAELGASRGLVDTGRVPYALQIGLTGRMVSPKVYVAIGISGAVQHTCAIANADTVIAWNPDKNARIFEFADYGILEAFS
ncbi:MAG: FAD-binding protein [Planctomycetia bacterium]|nr:FAD-binding protein [Planctomycetia bacterium]